MRDFGEWQRVIGERFWRGEREENPLGNVEKNHAVKPDVTGSNGNGFKGSCPTGEKEKEPLGGAAHHRLRPQEVPQEPPPLMRAQPSRVQPRQWTQQGTEFSRQKKKAMRSRILDLGGKSGSLNSPFPPCIPHLAAEVL